ncbi:PREDICTED: uncharacterized protein LOC108616731 [Drosophila arizonae]|uniref:Uncharacterized protein LOC108616731 n=1 Tax=Drosophila arizonae TaxID=7263 RepID=A0ABM1PK93_DROAR|nr:PREDICTED: uncharacterized protein LOC108616731 [Drosophila arizonae]XP_017867630.1 PREDICTED: uncharacterized protein LOC108616731 [Drosophila arizonae]XP_017867631.1 PREDICTED: uncharacterized protein LOC108616731 [Drosophila arizonae]
MQISKTAETGHIENGENVEMDNMLCDLIDIHKVKGNEEALRRVLQSIYSQLNSNNDVKFGTKLYDKLISVVIADRASVQVNREQIAKVLDAVQAHTKQFPWSGLCLLRKLSSISLCDSTNAEEEPEQLHPHAGQILEHMLDDFVRELGLEYTCSPQLFTVIQKLLQSELKESRKLAYSIMRKLLLSIGRSEDFHKDCPQLQQALKCVEPHWPAYVVIMEQLEQDDSHLVLPMLSGHLPRFVACSQDNDWLSWLRILYLRLLENRNKFVVRWTLEYFLLHSTVSELRRANLLNEFLVAANKTDLYDAEDYLLPEQNIKTFVQNSGAVNFLEALVLVPWQSLPLLHWLRSMPPRQPHVAMALILKICGHVKSMQHETLRYEAQNRMFDIFEPTIESFSLGDYIQFMRALCSNSDNFCRDHKRFTTKIATCNNISEELVHFDKNLFVIIYRTDVKIGIELHKKLSQLPKDQHGWWRLFSFFFSLKLECASERMQILDFYQEQYDLNIDELERFTDLNELQQYLVHKLECDTDEEISFVLHRAVDWFTCERLISWNQLDELNLKPAELLSQGTILTAQRLATLLNGIEARLEDESIIKSLIAYLKQFPDSVLVATAIVKYASAHWSVEESDQILNDVLEASQFLNINILCCTKSVPTSLLIRGILSGNPLSGEKCIEYGYLISQYNYFFTSCRKRDSYINFVIEGKTDTHPLLDELLRINNEMIDTRQGYVENCKDHRIKMRIARALLRITFKGPSYWSDQLWQALLAVNEHDNIRYMYECLVARCLPSVDHLLKRLQQLTELKSCQQLSLISVLHIYCLSKYNGIKLEQLQRIIDILLPLTMAANLQIRLFAQLVLHRLLLQLEDNNIKIPGVTNMKLAIENGLGHKLSECQYEGRLLLPKICYQTPDGLQAADFILYMTYAPCDEYFADALRPNMKLKSELGKYRSSLKYKCLTA